MQLRWIWVQVYLPLFTVVNSRWLLAYAFSCANSTGDRDSDEFGQLVRSLLGAPDGWPRAPPSPVSNVGWETCSRFHGKSWRPMRELNPVLLRASRTCWPLYYCRRHNARECEIEQNWRGKFFSMISTVVPYMSAVLVVDNIYRCGNLSVPPITKTQFNLIELLSK